MLVARLLGKKAWGVHSGEIERAHKLRGGRRESKDGLAVTTVEMGCRPDKAWFLNFVLTLNLRKDVTST